MTRRERVIRALNFQKSDQLPKDLGGMASTGISCFAYPKLVAALGLPQRLPRVFDTGQMLALPDTDVLDALDCDVVTIQPNCTNALEEPERWRYFDFDGRLPAMVNDPDSFEVQPDGSIIQHGYSVMLPESYVFNAPHAGQELSLSEDIPKEDLAELEVKLKEALPSAGSTASLGMYCRKARESTSRAIMFNGCAPGLGFRGGLANFSMLCLSEPDYVHRLHEILARHCIEKLERLLPAIWPSIDILMLSSDDQGTQSDSILPPPVFRELFVPYYKAITDSCRKLAPNLKIFLHSCGAIYPLLDDIADCGFDVLNPVQWTAGGHSYLEWKDRCRKRLAFWGGGVNSQTTLPLGSVDDVRREVSQIVPVLAKDSGYIFCNIHNLLAEIAPEKIIAMYQAAGACKY